MPDPIFHLIYQTWTAMQRDCDQQIAMHGIYIKSDVPLSQFAKVIVRVRAPDGHETDLAGEIVLVVPDQAVAVQFSEHASQAIDELTQHCKTGQHTQESAAEGDDPAIYPPGSEPPKAREAQISLPKRLEKMTVNEKRRTALHGSREERLLLIRDRNKTIHPFVLKNPSITLDEIDMIAKMPSVNPECLRMIAGNRDWIRSTSICRSLVRNPKTPMPDALKLMNKLPKSDLRAFAKSGNVRTAIQQAARKKILN
jgi:hypothetical protein